MSAKPTIEAFTPYEIGPKPWGTELVIAETDKYLVKLLTMKAGHRGGLQFHVTKKESFYLQKGVAQVLYETEDGNLDEKIMTAGQCFHIPPGAVHQVIAYTDCVFIEGSTPVFGDRVNVSARHALYSQGEAL